MCDTPHTHECICVCGMLNVNISHTTYITCIFKRSVRFDKKDDFYVYYTHTFGREILHHRDFIPIFTVASCKLEWRCKNSGLR